MCSAASQPMLRPNRAHLLVRRELASLGLREGFFKRSFVLDGQLDRRLILADELQKHARDSVLNIGRQNTRGLDRLIQKLCHA